MSAFLSRHRDKQPFPVRPQLKKAGASFKLKARVDAKFKRLHKLTVQQDKLNLQIRKEINDDSDPRWIPVHMIDDANGIILEVSQAEGHLGGNLDYVSEKVDGLNTKLFMLRMRRD